MDKVSGIVKVFFQEPFWIGVVEKISDGKLSVCKVTFGTEPKDYEVYDFILKNYNNLIFSPTVATDVKKTKTNPKRIQREIKRQVQNISTSTKSQQALSLQHEQMKTKRKEIKKAIKEAEKQRQFELKQQKRKKKHRGR